MRKSIYISAIIVLSLYKISAQQAPLFTQYIFNNFVYNPSIAGTNNYYQLRTNTRVQWVGLPEHPFTNVFSVFGPSKTKDMGFGGTFFSDVAGPTSRTGINGAYAYNIAINEDLRLSMGVSAGLLQYKIDASRIDLWDEEMDPLRDQVYSKAVPDASIGAYLYSYAYHFGISSSQLLNNKIEFIKNDTFTGISKLKRHFFMSGAYRYIVDQEWSVEPTLILKKTGAVPWQLDCSVNGIFKNMIWGGFAYRTGNTLSVILGYLHEKQYYFGYSYDFTLSSMRKWNSGSHEITIGYRFNDIKSVRK
mgnify:CR=1 FL=1